MKRNRNAKWLTEKTSSCKTVRESLPVECSIFRRGKSKSKKAKYKTRRCSSKFAVAPIDVSRLSQCAGLWYDRCQLRPVGETFAPSEVVSEDRLRNCRYARRDKFPMVLISRPSLEFGCHVVSGLDLNKLMWIKHIQVFTSRRATTSI